MTTITAINLYRRDGEWCYRADSVDGFDHSDTVGVANTDSEDQARAELTSQFPLASITRIGDEAQ